MKEKKNIDRLFQEQLKDFETLPDNQIWLNIEAELKKDKKQKVIPIWFKYAGIAAVFMLGLFLVDNYGSKDSKTENGIVLDKITAVDSIKNQIAPLQNNLKEHQIVLDSKNNIKDEKKEVNPNTIKIRTKNETAISYSKTKKSNDKKNQNDSAVSLSKNNSAINQVVINEKKISSKQLNTLPTTNSVENIPNKTTEKIAAKEQENSKNKLVNSPEKPNELEELLQKKEEQKLAIVNNSKNKWQISPNVAPIYLNAKSGGSPIDSQLSTNEKNAETSLSVGLGIQYAVNKKLAIRTGINKVVLGYNTNDVLYAAGLEANNLTNISYISNSSIEVKNSAIYNSLTNSEKSIQNTNTGTLNQKMGYYELPFELSYAVLDKKFGINIIGGLSTLFLNENAISLESSQTKVDLGQANNLSKVHLSSNLGLGFKYKIVKSFQLNFEPILKYQFNTFSQNSNNFKPMFIGLYSGVSYQF